ncbi:MAG: NAD(P)-dependent oxidoreductase [Paracoccaceae bacterium]|jgi:2-hydroxy-3-oxopropionate reductase|nr:NAD(P)-dependent oxidoreductase [Alphaproteobacteria bacterium]
MKIAFLGTGLMGGPMVKNLASAGYEITAWNRTSSKAEFLLQFGVDVKGLAADAVKNADVVVSMLSNGDASAQMQSDKDLQISLSSNATWIEMGSIKPDESRLHSKKLAELGVNYLDAPVSGGTKGAENGTLAIMVGGQRSVFKKVKNVFAPMGRAVFVGPTGSGQLAKLANQAIVAITIGAVAEATLLLEEGGADVGAVRDALLGGFADSTILQQHGKRMSERNFDPGGPSRLQLKDLKNILAEAKALNVDLPFSIAAHDRFSRLVNSLNGSELDHSALFLELLETNGKQI